MGDYVPAFEGNSGYFRPDEYYDTEKPTPDSYQPGFSRSAAAPPRRGRSGGALSPAGALASSGTPSPSNTITPLTPSLTISTPSHLTEMIYQAFLDYLGDVNLSISKVYDGWATYACRFTTGMMVESRYLFVSVRTNDPQDYATLSELNWVTLQFRTLKVDVDVQENMARNNRDFRRYLVYEMTAERSTSKGQPYIGPIPIRATILKGKTGESYPERLELYKIVETWNAVIDLL